MILIIGISESYNEMILIIEIVLKLGSQILSDYPAIYKIQREAKNNIPIQQTTTQHTIYNNPYKIITLIVVRADPNGHHVSCSPSPEVGGTCA